MTNIILLYPVQGILVITKNGAKILSLLKELIGWVHLLALTHKFSDSVKKSISAHFERFSISEENIYTLF